MTVIITMAGIGSRFRKAGYNEPKYRIIAGGRSLMEWSLLSMQAFLDERFIFACRKEDDIFWIKNICKTIGITDFSFSIRPDLSRGQAETAYDALSLAISDEPLWIYNIDTYVEPAAMKPVDIGEAQGCLHVFPSLEPNMSFVRYNDSGEVIEIAEKVQISNWATVGLYGFQSATVYSDLYKRAYDCDSGLTVGGERYVAPMYKLLLKQGLVIAPKLQSSDVHVLGTPEQVCAFNKAIMPPNAIIK